MSKTLLHVIARLLQEGVNKFVCPQVTARLPSKQGAVGNLPSRLSRLEHLISLAFFVAYTTLCPHSIFQARISKGLTDLN